MWRSQITTLYFGAGDWLRFFISTDDFSSLETVYNGARIHRLSLLMSANSTSLFSSDALDNSIGQSLETLSGRFNLQAGDLVYINSDASGTATAFSSSVVPVPAAVWLLGSALGVMGWMRRKVDG